MRLLVEMIEPYRGRVYDPCCGSGGMFVQSENFVAAHGGNRTDISIYGQESNPTTWRLCRMNLAIRGISGNIGSQNADSFPVSYTPLDVYKRQLQADTQDGTFGPHKVSIPRRVFFSIAPPGALFVAAIGGDATGQRGGDCRAFRRWRLDVSCFTAVWKRAHLRKDHCVAQFQCEVVARFVAQDAFEVEAGAPRHRRAA